MNYQLFVSFHFALAPPTEHWYKELEGFYWTTFFLLNFQLSANFNNFFSLFFLHILSNLSLVYLYCPVNFHLRQLLAQKTFQPPDCACLINICICWRLVIVFCLYFCDVSYIVLYRHNKSIRILTHISSRILSLSPIQSWMQQPTWCRRNQEWNKAQVEWRAIKWRNGINT